ncbi:ADP-ribosylglycohydrolase family protein [Saccharothrix lopnurensis]|uniref:ADP-ribosylglycohydrolase family protein n=1 Tax=Saccharothrix lopnurensis TaxID=1670621 RepID=A0ABW1PAB5_9PSEU
MTTARAAAERYRSSVRGCLLGGAVGNALGAPVERWSADRVLAARATGGVRDYPTDGPLPPGSITADTQLALFTAQGLIRAGIRRDRGIGLTVAVVHEAYDHWLDTQLRPEPAPDAVGPLGRQPWLHQRRDPGRTTPAALTANRRTGPRHGHRADNDSKGSGAVTRVAPLGLLPPDGAPDHWFFTSAADVARYTHGHPTARLAAGALGSIVHRLVGGADLDEALDAALDLLAGHEGHEETTAALHRARALARGTRPGTAGSAGAAGSAGTPGTPGTAGSAGTGDTAGLPGAAGAVGMAGAAVAAGVAGPADAVHLAHVANAVAAGALGTGRVAEEALAIAVCAALTAPGPQDVLDALSIAVTHPGGTAATGAVCGQLVGARHGETALPPELVFRLEGRGTVLELADDLAFEFTRSERLHGDYGPETGWRQRYS